MSAIRASRYQTFTIPGVGTPSVDILFPVGSRAGDLMVVWSACEQAPGTTPATWTQALPLGGGGLHCSLIYKTLNAADILANKVTQLYTSSSNQNVIAIPVCMRGTGPIRENPNAVNANGTVPTSPLSTSGAVLNTDTLLYFSVAGLQGTAPTISYSRPATTLQSGSFSCGQDLSGAYNSTIIAAWEPAPGGVTSNTMTTLAGRAWNNAILVVQALTGGGGGDIMPFTPDNSVGASAGTVTTSTALPGPGATARVTNMGPYPVAVKLGAGGVTVTPSTGLIIMPGATEFLTVGANGFLAMIGCSGNSTLNISTGVVT